MKEKLSNRREVMLYWLGLLLVAVSVVAVMMSISTLITTEKNMVCYFDYPYPVTGSSMSTQPQPMDNSTLVHISISNSTNIKYQFSTPNLVPPDYSYRYDYYPCGNTFILFIQFVFNLLSSLVFLAVGAYMMVNGEKK